MPANYSVSFNGSIEPMNLKEPASAWQTYDESFIDMEEKRGRKVRLVKEPRSPSAFPPRGKKDDRHETDSARGRQPPRCGARIGRNGGISSRRQGHSLSRRGR